MTYIPDMEDYQAYIIVGLITDVLREITRIERRSRREFWGILIDM